MTTDRETIPKETTFIEELRRETADSHTRLESLPVSRSLMSSSLSESQYATYLSLMFGIVTATERDVYPLISDFIPDSAIRLKSHLIKSDLEILNYSIPTALFNFTPRSAAFALGIFYVVEGSTLGGRYILKNVSATLGRDQESGASYFHGYGNTTGSMWKKFLNALSDYAATNGQHDEIIAGAKFAFESIHIHFEQACR